MPLLYRAMEEDGEGRPFVGSTARCLGIRAGDDIPVDDEGEVEPFSGGMSVTPHTPAELPFFRRPPSYEGGTGKDPAWEIDSGNLGEGLVYRPDDARPDTHGFVEPAWRMRLDEYEDLLALTRDSWRLA
jgi:hypothetical protein